MSQITTGSSLLPFYILTIAAVVIQIVNFRKKGKPSIFALLLYFFAVIVFFVLLLPN